MSWLIKEIWSDITQYDNTRSNFYADQVLNMVGNLSGSTFLDIGGGRGFNTLAIGKNFSEKYCLDLYTPENKLPGVSYIQGDAVALPFDNNYFDLVSMFSVIEHTHDPVLVLQEAIRVLKPSGLFVIQAPNWFFPVDLHTGFINPFLMPRIIRKNICT